MLDDHEACRRAVRGSQVRESVIVGILIRWAILAVAVAVAAWILPGIHVSDSNGVITVIVMAGVLGLVNTFIRPILNLLSCGCIVATLGLFLFVINALMFWLASWIAENWLDSEFEVESFWWALAGSIITGIVSFVLELVFGTDVELRWRR
jgi:putative membrane protein